MILISNVRISASMKVNWMAWAGTLTVLSTVFERTEQEFYGFQQTVESILVAHRSFFHLDSEVFSKSKRKLIQRG